MATIEDLLAVARAQVGKPYVFGAAGPGSFDCSGLVQYAYAALGIKVPRTAAEQQAAAKPVGQPQPGDLVFWGAPAYHVALYAGNGQVIAAPQPGEAVKVQPVWGSPTYGRVASLSSGGGPVEALQNVGGSIAQASFGMDKLFKQVEGVSLQLAMVVLGLALVGAGLWKASAPQRAKIPGSPGTM